MIIKEKHKLLLRWLSVVPIGFTAFFVADWATRLFIWFWLFPIEILDNVFGAGFLGKLIDDVSVYLLGIDFITAITVVISNFIIGYMVVYLSTIISPADKKKMVSVITVVCLFLIGGAFFVWVVNSGVNAEYLLVDVLLIIGVISGRQAILGQKEDGGRRYEAFISRNILLIFVGTLLFTTAITALFLL